MADGHIHKHLQSMFHVLRNEETLKMVSGSLSFFFVPTSKLFLDNSFVFVMDFCFHSFFPTGGQIGKFTIWPHSIFSGGILSAEASSTEIDTITATATH